MAKKSRDPDKISHDDLTTWGGDMVDWLADHAADPDLTPRAADFPPLVTAYIDAYHAEIAPEQYAPLLHKELEDIDDPLIAVLQLLRHRIPLLPGVEEPALADFGLGVEVETDWDKLKAVAAVCKAHWLDISGAGTPPEYLAVEGNMIEMVDTATVFISKHEAYRVSVGDKQDAIAYKNICRDALLECEREIFVWYKAAHWSGKDEWWRTTPWGCTGQSEEPGGPELPQIPEKPTGFAVELRMEPSPFMLISCDPYGEHSGFDIKREETPAGVTEPPEMGEELFMQNTGLPLMDGEIVLGTKYWYQIRARNGEEVGEWTEIVSVEYK